jgi:photosystem II stability/assembly factor-like uncharacterized protein
MRTDDAGETWVAETQCGQAAFCGTADLTYLDMVDSMTGFAGGPEVALRTTDGQHWYEYTNTAVTAVHFVSPVEGWAVAATDPDLGGNIVHSTDGGMTWTVLPGTDRAQAVCFASPTDGWYSNTDTLFRSTDGGASWTKSLQSPAGGDTGTTVALQCTADGGAWVQFTVHNGATGHIPYLLYSTQDAGSHWSLVFDSQFSFASSVPAPDGPGSQPGPFSIIDGATAFATGNTPAAGSVAGELVTNGSSLGTTRPVGHGDGFFASAASFISTTRGWVAGEEGGAGAIYATTDGGITWVRQL